MLYFLHNTSVLSFYIDVVFTLLCSWYNRKLSSKENIAYVTGKIDRSIGVITKVIRYLDKDSLLSLYYSFVYLYRVATIYMGRSCENSYWNFMHLTQKRAVKIISGVKPSTHSDPLFKELNVLKFQDTWWRYQMEIFSALLAFCAGNSPVTGEFPTQRPVMLSFDFFFDLHLNKRLGKQSWCWWFETPSRSLWRHCNDQHLPQWKITMTSSYFNPGFKTATHFIITILTKKTNITFLVYN